MRALVVTARAGAVQPYDSSPCLSGSTMSVLCNTTLRRVGKRIVLALPLALGDPVPLANEFYGARSRSVDYLEIFTA